VEPAGHAEPRGHDVIVDGFSQWKPAGQVVGDVEPFRQMEGCVHGVLEDASQKWPAGHSTQDDMPGSDAKKPEPHVGHSEGVAEYDPGSHNLQNDMPEALAMEPASQTVHADSAECSAIVPGSHSVHVLSPLVGEYAPGLHAEHWEECEVSEYIPGRHMSQ